MPKNGFYSLATGKGVAFFLYTLEFFDRRLRIRATVFPPLFSSPCLCSRIYDKTEPVPDEEKVRLPFAYRIFVRWLPGGLEEWQPLSPKRG